ncbi:MAG TPA: alpha/beta hydrolase [Spirochaetota bacterium]|nr:alpha/beta hydrolase [Spirochaetota bacterium]HOM09659.1 alpha/beta hydrolase [Spirochaetota bacterium]HPP50429.1 alpha/beta hydrolase [Spirochaetota bacterium]HXK65343.1 alpha/beta hydrolase [Spirochaetota bacterium]
MHRRKSIVLIIASLFVYVSCSSSLLNFFRWYERSKAGLTEKTVMIDGHTVHYLEGGKGDTVLCIHGFGGTMDHWTRFARYVTDAYRVVALDLPGFGDSSFKEGGDYSIAKQVERVHEFAHTLKLQKFHIVGNSMGGYIAGYYAITYPDDVITLGLFAAAGVKSPNESELAKELKKGNNPLIVEDVESYDRLMEFVFYKPIWLPGFAKQYFATQAVAKKTHFQYIFKQIHDVTLLEKYLGNIHAPTLLLWGENDRVLDVSGAYVFKEKIRNAQLVVFKECGHLPMIEKPEESATVYKRFLKGQKVEL